MAAAQRTIDQYVVLRSVSWEAYERLLADHQGSSGTRFYYDNGMLEIKVPSIKHEEPNRALAQVVEILAEEMNLDLRRLGSTTFNRVDLMKGFEPDSSYYIQNAEAIRGKEKLDLKTDPPPDLVIEIDITTNSLNKFPIFAGIGVPEVWRYDEGKVTIHQLSGKEYVEADHSLAFPPLTGEMATNFLEESREMKSTAWSRRVREWVREQLSEQVTPVHVTSARRQSSRPRTRR